VKGLGGKREPRKQDTDQRQNKTTGENLRRKKKEEKWEKVRDVKKKAGGHGENKPVDESVVQKEGQRTEKS